jgi:hypothetical protein
MKVPDSFFRYFALTAFVLLIGIALAALQTTVMQPDLAQCNETQLNARLTFQEAFVTPRLATVYPLVLFINAGVALFLLFVPLYWAGIWYLRRDLLPQVILLMRATVLLLMLSLGHNTFSKIGELFATLPPNVAATYYYPHGILEALSFVLAGTFSLLCISSLEGWLAQKSDTSGLHIGNVVNFIVSCTWRIYVVIVVILAVSAAIECFVTPSMVEAAYRTALAGMAG